MCYQGSYLGEESFKDELLAMVDKARAKFRKQGHCAGGAVAAHHRREAERIIRVMAARLDLPSGTAELAKLGKGHPLNRFEHRSGLLRADHVHPGSSLTGHLHAASATRRGQRNQTSARHRRADVRLHLASRSIRVRGLRLASGAQPC